MNRCRQLTRRIYQIFIRSRRLYGSPKITQVLRQEGIRVGGPDYARTGTTKPDRSQIQGDHRFEPPLPGP
ncbi:IS3 family transposase [Alicyclobacillus shizuokensis]|uniref:IS3 family transposase n=1 Tax=Alicyclobacillus shizuokensis TaxID=392014 RepID=UPI003570C176